MVYDLKKHDLTIRFIHLDQKKPEVVVALGSEVRTFQLQEFINFWLDMVKVGRKVAAAHSALTRSVASVGKDRTPRAYHLKRHGLRIMFTCLGRNKPEVVVALGPEARTFQFEEFIDFWLDMVELAPKAAYVHLAEMRESGSLNIERKIWRN